MPTQHRDHAVLGLLVGTVGVGMITAIEILFELPAAVPALLLLVPVAAGSTIGGWRIGMILAVLAALSFGVYSAEPVGSPAMRIGADVGVLVTLTVVALAVSFLINRRARVDREVLDTRRVALLSGVSHDLRSPLTTIRAISTDLLAASDLYDDATRDRMLERVVDESARLDRIVGNLLSTVRIQSGALKPSVHPESMAAIVELSVGRLLRNDHTSRIDICVPRDLPEVGIDAVQYDQVVTNLLENAIRHGASDEPVRVVGRWPSPMSGDGYVELSILDRGSGFASQARARAFQPFNASVSATASTGLGLTVCKAIVEAHGGTIWLREQRGRGAEISFTVPVATVVGDDPARRG